MARGKGSGRHPGRGRAVRVKTARRRSVSSTRWLQRQLSDPYVAEARRLGYRSRAAFKLIEIDDKARLLRPGRRVVDLGAAPGGWTQVAVERVKPEAGKGVVVALDIAEMAPVPGAVLLHMDLLDGGAPAALREALGGPADLVLSDMSPAATGHAATDHLRIMALAEAALEFAEAALAPGGAFVVKVFEGGASRELLTRLRQGFARVRHVKPASSRKDSREIYVLATGFRGGEEA